MRTTAWLSLIAACEPGATTVVGSADVDAQAAAAAPVELDVGQDALATWTSWYGGLRGYDPDLVAAGDLDGDGVSDWVIDGQPSGTSYTLRETWRVASNAPSGPVGAVGRLVESGAFTEVPQIVGGARDDDGDGRSEVYGRTLDGIVRLALDPAGAGWTLLGEAAVLTNYGYDRALGRDFTGDGFGDVVVADRVFYGPLVGRNTDRDGAEIPITSASNRLAGVGDLDGDGIDDLVVLHTTVQVADLAGAPPAPSFGPGSIDNAPIHAGAVGDLDGDGYADLALGGTGSDRTFIVPGPFPTVATDINAASVAQVVGGSLVASGGSATVGDVDGDGADDLALRAADEWFGRLAFAHGPLAGTIDPATLPQYRGATPYDDFAGSVAAQDIDGDGVYELAVAASQWGHGTVPAQGAVYLLEAL